MHIEFLWFRDCPSHEDALARLKAVLAEEQRDPPITVTEVTSDEQAQTRRFPGSPTILINGKDIDPPSDNAFFGLTCRTYTHEDGRFSPLPSKAMIRKALRAAETA